MLEKHLASTFNRVLDSYKIWTMTTKQGGLPDKGVQLNNSKIVWFELKVVQARPEATFICVPTLESHQAVWLANWQKNDGDCYLFIGALNIKNRTISYGVWQCADWRDWIKVPTTRLPLNRFQIYTTEAVDIFHWFQNRYGLIKPAR